MPDSHSPEASDNTEHPLRGLAVVAAASAITALWVAQRARAAEREHPPPGGFLEIDGANLHYLDQGEGPPVVLLHGNGISLQDFVASGLFDTLARRHRVIALDRPGFGFSARPRKRRWTPQAQASLLRQALARLGVEHPVIVGHSWGAIVALALAISAPDAVSGLVLVSGYYYPTKRPDVWLNVVGASPVLGDMLRYTALPLLWRLSLKRAIRTLFAPAPAPENYLERVPKELIVRPSQIRAASEDASFMVSAVRKLAPFYSHLTMPVTLLAGKGDLVVDPEAHSMCLHRDITHSTLHVIPGTGHMVHHSDMAAVANAVGAMTGGGPYLIG